jgi:hypothetical protein
MTLRDYFAAKAMQGLIANHISHAAIMKIANGAGISEESALAKMSYIVADGMMKGREQT